MSSAQARVVNLLALHAELRIFLAEAELADELPAFAEQLVFLPRVPAGGGLTTRPGVTAHPRGSASAAVSRDSARATVSGLPTGARG